MGTKSSRRRNVLAYCARLPPLSEPFTERLPWRRNEVHQHPRPQAVSCMAEEPLGVRLGHAPSTLQGPGCRLDGNLCGDQMEICVWQVDTSSTLPACLVVQCIGLKVNTR